MTDLSNAEMMEALSAWLRTFPQLDGIASELEGRNWIRKNDIIQAILNSVHEMKNGSSHEFNENMDATSAWSEISMLLGLGDVKATSEDEKVAIEIVSQILCQAVVPSDNDVSEKESEHMYKMREIYIARILELDEQHQRVLMRIIEDNGKSDEEEREISRSDQRNSPLKHPLSPLIDNKCSQSYDFDDGFINDHTNSQTERYNLSPTSPSPRKKMKILTQKERELEAQLKSLQDANEKLSREREAALESEIRLREELDQSKARALKDSLHLETQLLERENELRNTYETELDSLKRDLSKSEEQRIANDQASSELAILKDEIDILKHSSSRLDSTEEQLRKCKAKLLELQDVKEQLSREESARERVVQQVIDLENELTSLAPLRRQLETYKTRATTAEVKLAEVSDELERFQNEARCLSSKNDQLAQLSEIYQCEKDELQRKLKEDSESMDSQALLVGLGEGMSELNPQVSEEIARLRHENEELKKYVAKHTQDAVERLEGDLDDSHRLVDSFKSQFLSTKASLESTTNQLKTAKETIEELEQQLEVCNNEIIERDSLLDTERLQHIEELERIAQIHNEEKDQLREESKIEMENREKKLNKIFSNEREILNERLLKSEKDMINAKEAAVNQLEDLKKSMEDLLQSEKERHVAQIEQLKQDSDSALKASENEREELIKKGKSMIVKERADASLKLKRERDDHEKFVNGVKTTLAKYRQDQAEYEEKAKSKISSYKKKLLVATSRINELERSRLESSEVIDNLEKVKHNLNAENDRLRRQIGSKKGSDSDFEVQYHSLQREFQDLLEQNKKLKEKIGSTGSQPCSPFNIVDTMSSYSCGGGINGSTLTQLRSEYEETIEGLKDEKRELVMKISAAITEKKRAEQRSCNLEEELSKTKDKLASTELSLQRFDYRQVEYCEKRDKNRSEASSIVTDASGKSNLTSDELEKSFGALEEAAHDSSTSSKENDPNLAELETSISTPKNLAGPTLCNVSVLSTRSNKSPTPDLSKIMPVGRNVDTNNQECTQS